MRMRFQRWSRLVSVFVLIAAASLAVRAQEPPAPLPPPAEEEPAPPEPETPPPPAPTPTPTPTPAEVPPPTAGTTTVTVAIEEPKHWNIDVEEWIAQPSGLDYVAVVVADPNNPGASVQLGTQHGTEAGLRIFLGYTMLGDAGRFSLKYWSHEDQSNFSEYSPGDFSLGAQLLPVRFGGAFDDGAADAFDSHAATTVRDLRLNYSREAFATRRAIGRWSVGLREVDHNREFGGRYYGLLTGMPLVIGRADLEPQPDLATVISRFSGRGPDFGFDVQFPLGKRFRFAAELSAAMLRGDLESAYSSLTHIYAVVPGGVIEQVLGNELVPYVEEWLQLPTSGPDARPEIEQLSVPAGVVNTSRSASAQVLEGSLSFRFRAWRELEVFGGFRSTRYADVGVEVRPILGTGTVIGQSPSQAQGITGRAAIVPVVGVVEATRSVDYEGFFLGLGYTF